MLADDHAGGCVLYEKRGAVEAILSDRYRNSKINESPMTYNQKNRFSTDGIRLVAGI